MCHIMEAQGNGTTRQWWTVSNLFTLQINLPLLPCQHNLPSQAGTLVASINKDTLCWTPSTLDTRTSAFTVWLSWSFWTYITPAFEWGRKSRLDSGNLSKGWHHFQERETKTSHDSRHWPNFKPDPPTPNTSSKCSIIQLSSLV
jgi:hypothetical protein